MSRSGVQRECDAEMAQWLNPPAGELSTAQRPRECLQRVESGHLRPPEATVITQRMSDRSNDTVHCETHGEAPRTFVCQHVADGLIKHERVGFFWSIEDPD